MLFYITVFGVTDCEDTRRTRAYLASHGYHFSYVNLDEDKEAERMVTNMNGGERRTPYVVVQFGDQALTLRVPSDEKLESALLNIPPLQIAA